MKKRVTDLDYNLDPNKCAGCGVRYKKLVVRGMETGRFRYCEQTGCATVSSPGG